MAARPSVAAVAARVGADPADPVLAAMLDAASEAQADVCNVDPYTAALAEALIRRTAGLWASKASTLGVLETGTDYGIQYVPRYDPVVDGLERRHRRPPLS